ITTHDASGSHTAFAAPADKRLRASTPVAIAALGLAYLSIVFLRTRRRWVLPIAALAILAASIPLEFEGSPEPSTLSMGAAAFIPASALVLKLGRWRWLTVAALGGLAG